MSPPRTKGDIAAMKVVKKILVNLKSQSHLNAAMIMKMLIWKLKNLYCPIRLREYGIDLMNSMWDS